MSGSRSATNGFDEMLAIAHSNEPLSKTYYENVPGDSEQRLDDIHSLQLDGRRIISVNLPNREIRTGTVDILTISASQCGSGEIESLVDEILIGRGPR